MPCTSSCWIKLRPRYNGLLNPERSAAAQEYLATLPGVSGVEAQTEQNHQQRTRLEVKFAGDDTALSAMLIGLAARSIPIVHFSEDSQNLEDIFMKLTKSSLD